MGVDAFKLSLSESVANRQHDLLYRQRLFDEVERAKLRRADSRFDIAMSRNHHHRRVNPTRAQLLQRLHPVNSGKPNIQQYTAVSATLESLEAFFTRRSHVRRQTLILQHAAQRVADTSLVINYENRFRHCSKRQESEARSQKPEEKKICESGFRLIILTPGFWILLFVTRSPLTQS